MIYTLLAPLFYGGLFLLLAVMVMWTLFTIFTTVVTWLGGG